MKYTIIQTLKNYLKFSRISSWILITSVIVLILASNALLWMVVLQSYYLDNKPANFNFVKEYWNLFVQWIKDIFNNFAKTKEEFQNYFLLKNFDLLESDFNFKNLLILKIINYIFILIFLIVLFFVYIFSLINKLILLIKISYFIKKQKSNILFFKMLLNIYWLLIISFILMLLIVFVIYIPLSKYLNYKAVNYLNLIC